jgi:broad specificity phosphatase PhoE
MEADYDRLSPLGQIQAQKLGEYLSRHRITFDRVVHGPAKRHLDTMRICGESVSQAGIPWPEPEPDTSLDEFDAFTVMRIILPVMQKDNTVIRRLSQEFSVSQGTPQAGRHLQKLFEEVAKVWATGQYDSPEVESWGEFRRRIGQAIRQLTLSAKPSSNTAVFTSGGVIAAAVGCTLGLDPLQTMEFVWMSRNASYTQLVFSGERMSLHAFNAIPHLDDLSLFTYR